ncbi:EpsG family protein, partial [Staphylococcus cohnii]|uniref:EpsG family protein n=1 Tax=Staphylococcus cohnii TaxID=29382 RepID=UPI0010572DCA
STDYLSYVTAFNNIKNLDFYELIKVDIFEVGFRFISWIFINTFSNSTFTTFTIFVILINIILATSIYRFFENKILSVFSLLIYTYSPLFLDMSINILRQMLVISVIMLVLTLKKEKKWISLTFPILHLSSVVLVPFMFFQKKINVKYFAYFCLICLFMFITNLNSKLFGSLPIVSDYISQQAFESYGGQSNRLDFLFLIIMVVLLSL